MVGWGRDIDFMKHQFCSCRFISPARETGRVFYSPRGQAMSPRKVALILLVPLSVAGLIAWIHLLLRCLFKPDKQAREIMLSLDAFANAGMFGGSRFETVSSHAGREMKKETWWALVLNKCLEVLLQERNHCAATNDIEQPLLDVIERHEHEQRN